MNELTSIGLILLLALMAGHLVKIVRIPEVTGYILVGVALGPSVLGWKTWRDLQTDLIGKGLSDAIKALIASGAVAEQDPEALAMLIIAALNEAALEIAHSGDPDGAFARVGRSFDYIVEGLFRKN